MGIENSFELNPDSRRQALVTAAFNRLAAKGFEGLRLREVAAEVGINHATLHHYFPTKEDLVAAVVEHTTRQFWPTMPVEGDPLDRLQHHLGVLGQMMGAQPELFIVLAELELRAERDAAVREVLEAQEAGWRKVLTEVLREGVGQGIWAATLDTSVTVELIIAAVKGIRLLPGRAAAVLGQLERLLLIRPPGDSRKVERGKP